MVPCLKFCTGVVGAGGIVHCFPVSLPCNISIKLVLGRIFYIYVIYQINILKVKGGDAFLPSASFLFVCFVAGVKISTE